MMSAATSIGTANPMPCALWAAAELTPMTAPAVIEQRATAVAGVDGRVRLEEAGHRASSGGCSADPTSIVRPVADRIPDVTDSVNVPSGLPMAITCWPTFRVEASPIGIVGKGRRSGRP